MSVTPDKSALAQARERLEAAWAERIHTPSGKTDCATCKGSDIRLVLDALAEPRCTAAERAYLDADFAYFADRATRFSAECAAKLSAARQEMNRERAALRGEEASRG